MRVIPIAPSARSGADTTSCHEEGGSVPKLDLPLARREFLKGSGILMGTIATGSVLATLAPSPVWAVELKTLSMDEGQTLMAMGRTLYPHKKLPDAVYARRHRHLLHPADPGWRSCAAAACSAPRVYQARLLRRHRSNSNRRSPWAMSRRWAACSARPATPPPSSTPFA